MPCQRHQPVGVATVGDASQLLLAAAGIRASGRWASSVMPPAVPPSPRVRFLPAVAR